MDQGRDQSHFAQPIWAQISNPGSGPFLRRRFTASPPAGLAPVNGLARAEPTSRPPRVRFADNIEYVTLTDDDIGADPEIQVIGERQSRPLPRTDVDTRRYPFYRSQLFILLHAQKCTRKAQASHRPPGCAFPRCRATCDLLQHMTGCTHGRDCRYRQCTVSRRIITHWRHCAIPLCRICLGNDTTTMGRDRNNEATMMTFQPLQPMDLRVTNQQPRPIPVLAQAQSRANPIVTQPQAGVAPSIAGAHGNIGNAAPPNPPTLMEVDQENNMCGICMEQPKNTAFLCGHVCCHMCAQPLNNCHMCRKKIEKRIRLFM